MKKIVNLTASPHQLRTASKALVMLPAFGSIEGEFSDDYLDLLDLCGQVRIESVVLPDEAEIKPATKKRRIKKKDRAD